MSSPALDVSNAEPEAPEGKLHIQGVPLLYFAILLAVVAVAVYTEVLPHNLATGMAVTMVIGGALNYIGTLFPAFGMFGGGPILCLIVPAVLLYFGLVPESFGEMSSHLFNETGFSDLVVVGIVVGSLLGMSKSLLIKVGVRFFVPMVAGMATALVVGYVVGTITGIGGGNAVMLIVGPAMAGGIAAGVVPMSEIYAAQTGGDAGGYLEQLTPIVILANFVCILFAGVLNGLGKKVRHPLFSGEGRMLRRNDQTLKASTSGLPVTLRSVTIGVFISGAVYVLGLVLAAAVPSVHMYIWVILIVVALKMFNLLPDFMQMGAEAWSDFITYALTPSVLVALSAGLMDIDAILSVVVNPTYLVTIVCVVLAAAIGAGVAGLLIGFYFVESSISAGLAMADMGGSGDLALLSASGRMHLIPFLQIATRLGGLLMLVVASALAPIFL
ncbi:2-hydroxycarboxylate transporter family protein [Arthrobacter sp. USHLN218]|uniref:2-hydroxycarboxylate transporter family protein n=1 Tax=Arthrobacter sp. USHLN218 TaxID=3081232 RepID=UPI00301AEF1A